MKIILTCCLVLVSGSLFAAQPPAKAHITVSGHGVVRVVPDVLTLRLSIDKREKKVDAAKQDVDQRTSKVIAVARNVGIKKHDITSTQIYITPRYETHNDKRELAGYEVRRQLTLKLRDTDKYESLLKKLVGAGVNGIDGISRSYSHPAALRDKAFDKAVSDAHDKAERLAQAFHARLGEVHTIDEQSSPEPRPLMQRNASFAAAAKSSTFEPGTVDVEARIQVTYLLKP
jgi:uncharacterized protein YggE